MTMLTDYEQNEILETTRFVFQSGYISLRKGVLYDNNAEEKTEIAYTKFFGNYRNNVSIVQDWEGNMTCWPAAWINYSYNFSGCAMGLYFHKGRNYICHIALDGYNRFRGSNNENWAKITQNGRFRNIFFPYHGKTEEYIRKVIKRNKDNDPKRLICIGIIRGNDCYSMVYDKALQQFIFMEKWLPLERDRQYIYGPGDEKKYLQYSLSYKTL